MSMNQPRLRLIALALLFAPLPVSAIQGALTTTVLRTLTTGDNVYGGCMAYLAAAVNKASSTPNCPGNYVSFSCTGTYTSKDLALLQFDQAQLALATNKSVIVYVDDARKHNGNCYAYRIDVIK